MKRNIKYKRDGANGASQSDLKNEESDSEPSVDSVAEVLDTLNDSDGEQGLLMVITILFMSHRIQAKVFQSDSYQSFLDRLRCIWSTIDSSKQIGLYHLDQSIITQEEELLQQDKKREITLGVLQEHQIICSIK